MKKVLVKFQVPSSNEFKNQCDDVKTLILARAGQHTKAIARQLGMSPGQAQYRIIKGMCKGTRREFRDGYSEESKIAVKAIARHVLNAHVRKLLRDV